MSNPWDGYTPPIDGAAYARFAELIRAAVPGISDELLDVASYFAERTALLNPAMSEAEVVQNAVWVITHGGIVRC